MLLRLSYRWKPYSENKQKKGHSLEEACDTTPPAVSPSSPGTDRFELESSDMLISGKVRAWSCFNNNFIKIVTL